MVVAARSGDWRGKVTVFDSGDTEAGDDDLPRAARPHCRRDQLPTARRGMCARSGDTTVCIDIQGKLAIVPWMPMMAGTLAT